LYSAAPYGAMKPAALATIGLSVPAAAPAPAPRRGGAAPRPFFVAF